MEVLLCKIVSRRMLLHTSALKYQVFAVIMSQDISDISFDRSTLDPNYPTESSLASCGEKCGAEVRGEKQWWRRDCQEAKPSSWVYQSQVSYAKLDLLSRTCSNACS